MNTKLTYCMMVMALTPASPTKRISWILKRNVVRAREALDTISEDPLPALCSSMRQWSLGRTKCRRLVFFRAKYSSGIKPPTAQPMDVAMAAPAMPHWNTAMNSQSSTILVTPLAMVSAMPSLGFSAVMKNVWKKVCSM